MHSSSDIYGFDAASKLSGGEYLRLHFVSQTAVVEGEVVGRRQCDNEKPLWDVVIEVGKERDGKGMQVLVDQFQG